MILYYEELNDEEKNAVTKVIRTLLKQTFVLERKYDKKSGRPVSYTHLTLPTNSRV